MEGDKKLKVAAEEIKDILRKHNIAGSINLHTPGYGESFLHFNTDYSCAYRYEENMLHFYAQRKDYKTIEEWEDKIKNTSNMLAILSETTSRSFLNLNHFSGVLDRKVNAKHSNLNINYGTKEE